MKILTTILIIILITALALLGFIAGKIFVTGSSDPEIEPDKTRWVMETEFKFSGMMRVMALFMRGAFPKQTRKMMDNFKQFAEGVQSNA